MGVDRIQPRFIGPYGAGRLADRPTAGGCVPAARFRIAWRWRACAGSSASAIRSMNRRRAPALSVNRRSMAGVNQPSASHSPSEAALASAPLIRTNRRARRGARVYVPRRTASISVAPRRDQRCADGKPPVHTVWPAISAKGCTPQSTPGGKQRYRFQHIGFARTVFADQQVELARFRSMRVRVIAERKKG